MKKLIVYAGLLMCSSVNSAEIIWKMSLLNSVKNNIAQVGVEHVLTCPNGAWSKIREPLFFESSLIKFDSSYSASSFFAADRGTIQYREREISLMDSIDPMEQQSPKDNVSENIKKLSDIFMGAKSSSQEPIKAREVKYSKNIVGYSWAENSPIKTYLFKPKIVFNEYEEAAFSEGIINLSYEDLEKKSNYKNTFTVLDSSRRGGRYLYEMTSKDGVAFVLDGHGDWIFPNGKLSSISSDDFPPNGSGFQSEYTRLNNKSLIGIKSIKSILGNVECRGNSVFARSVHRIFLGGDVNANESYGYMLIEREVRLNPKVEPDKSKQFGF